MTVSLEPPRTLDHALLPVNSSPRLKLVPASAREARQASILNGQAWRGPLSVEDYLSREEHLNRQALSKNGGCTVWVLVDTALPEKERTFLAACETLRKRAIVAGPDGIVRDVVSHGIGSVFCRDEYRGRGYAQRMMCELRKVLESWQQQEGEKASFNVLYSDIGKTFYARSGWIPFSSAHILLGPTIIRRTDLVFPPVEAIGDHHIDELCEADEVNLRQVLKTRSPGDKKIRLAYLPDAGVMRWHHAREEFLASKILGQTPKVKGACVHLPSGKRVWAIWTRSYRHDELDNTLFILRVAIEDSESLADMQVTNGVDSSKPNPVHAMAVAACLDAAQKEAAAWNMYQVELWNPSPTVLAAAKICEPATKMKYRDTESIPSLLWYEQNEQSEVEWVCNEKFGWC